MISSKLYKSYSIFFLTFFLAFSSLLSGADLHLLILADTTAVFKKDVEIDIKRVETTLGLISRVSGMSLKKKVFETKNITPREFISSLHKLKIKKDDAFVFYFSGHGFHAVNQPNPWPILRWKEKESIAFELKDLIELVKSKKPRFSLILTDCCNNIIKGLRYEDLQYLTKQRHSLQRYKANARKLFLEQRGQIVGMSCSTGETSVTTSKYGGVFTAVFFLVLQRELLTATTIKWDSIFKKTTLFVKEAEKGQTPLFISYDS